MENRSGARSRDTLYLNKNLIMMGLTVNEKKIMIHVCVCHLVSTKGFELSMYIILIFIKGFHQKSKNFHSYHSLILITALPTTLFCLQKVEHQYCYHYFRFLFPWITVQSNRGAATPTTIAKIYNAGLKNTFDHN